MANIKKIEADRLAVIYDEKRRPSSEVTNKEDLKVEGQVFVTYAPTAGAMYRFESFDDCTIKKQPVRADNIGPDAPSQLLISCEVSEDGGKTWIPTWFSLNHLAKQKVVRKEDGTLGQVPVHPTWFALGNTYERAKKLCEMGSIQVDSKDVTIESWAFNDGGKRVTRVVVDAEKKPVLNEDGSPRMEYATTPQTVHNITPAK